MSTVTIQAPEVWCAGQCKHIESEGRWPELLIDQQLKSFPDWGTEGEGPDIELAKRYELGQFDAVKKALNALTALADKQDHHPRVEFSYGYMWVGWSTHSAKGISDNDWICAALLDQALASLTETTSG